MEIYINEPLLSCPENYTNINLTDCADHKQFERECWCEFSTHYCEDSLEDGFVDYLDIAFCAPESVHLVNGSNN